MADNYDNTQGPDSMETQPMQQTGQGQQDFGVTDPSNVNTGVGPTGTDDTAPQDFSSEGVGMPKDYQGGEQGGYDGNQQLDSGYGATGGDQQVDAGYGAGDMPAQDSNYQSPMSEQNVTGSYDQPTSDQSQFAQNTGAAGTDQTNGYGAGAPPSTGYGTGTETPADESTGTAPKKEGFLTKLKEKLPGHHKSSDELTDAAYDDETGDQAPKKGLMTKIKEKVHM